MDHNRTLESGTILDKFSGFAGADMRVQFFIATLALGIVLLIAPFIGSGTSIKAVALAAALGVVPAYGLMRLLLRTHH